MKKIICIIVIVLLHLPVFAQNPEGEQHIKWVFDNQGVLTIKKNSSMQDYGEGNAPWSYLRDKIKTVIIENGVTNIGKCAFWGCRNMTSVTIPQSVKTIGERAFYNCNKLENVTIPNSVTTIGAEAFYKCSNLRTATVPKGLKEISRGLFRKCNNLKSVTIPDGVTAIGDYAFEGCAGITALTIPKNVKEIGNYSFKGCGIVEITIPEGVTTIGMETFSYCTFLEKVTLSSSVRNIHRNAFLQCPRLVDVYIHSSSVPQVEGNPFGSNYKKICYWIPNERLRNYEYDKYWSRTQLRSIGGTGQPVERETISYETASKSTHMTPSTSTTNTQIAYVVTASPRLNVRSDANSSASVIGTLQYGDTIQIEKIENNDWGQIRLNGRLGYVSTKYIKETVVVASVEKESGTSSSRMAVSNSASYASSGSVSSLSKEESTASVASANTASAATPSNGITLGLSFDLVGTIGKIKGRNDAMGSIGGDFVIGFYTPKGMNFLGAGLGLENYFCNSNDSKISFLYMPLFVNDKFYFTPNQTAPFFDFSLGGFVGLLQKVNDVKVKTPGGGFFMRSGLGLRFKLGFSISVGYELKFAESIDNASHCAYIKIGGGP